MDKTYKFIGLFFGFLIVSFVILKSAASFFLKDDLPKPAQTDNKAGVSQKEKPLARYLYRKDVKDISNINFQQKVPEIPASLIIKPGIYNFNGYTYNMQQEGLYRFIFTAPPGLQRIVFNKDTAALISAFSWLISQ